MNKSDEWSGSELEKFSLAMKKLCSDNADHWDVACVPPRNVFCLYCNGEEVIEIPFCLSTLFFKHMKRVKKGVRQQIQDVLSGKYDE